MENIEPLNLDNFPPFPAGSVHSNRWLAEKINELAKRLNDLTRIVHPLTPEKEWRPYGKIPTHSTARPTLWPTFPCLRSSKRQNLFRISSYCLHVLFNRLRIFRGASNNQLMNPSPSNKNKRIVTLKKEDWETTKKVIKAVQESTEKGSAEEKVFTLMLQILEQQKTYEIYQ